MNKKLFSQTVPFNIAKDENIKDLSCVIDNIAIDIKQKTEMVLLLPKLKELPDSILNELAYQFHVDFYREYFDHDTKVKLIESSIATHKIKGTPYAVEKVCTDIFKSAKVIENWEYGGEAYHFKVSFIKEAVTDVSKIDSLMEAISSTKMFVVGVMRLVLLQKLIMIFYFVVVKVSLTKWKYLKLNMI